MQIRVVAMGETRTLERVSKRRHQVRDAIEVIKQKMPTGPTYGRMRFQSEQPRGRGRREVRVIEAPSSLLLVPSARTVKASG